MVGRSFPPINNSIAVIANRTEATAPARRTQMANVLGALVSVSTADHKATPPAKDETLFSSAAAVPDSNRLSPARNTRKPAATQSSFLRKYLKARRAVATTMATPSIAQKICRIAGYPTNVPARPNTPLTARPAEATMSRRLHTALFTCPLGLSGFGRALFLRLGAEAQRIPLGRARFSGARGLGFGDVLREQRHHTDPLAMRGHHHV